MTAMTSSNRDIAEIEPWRIPRSFRGSEMPFACVQQSLRRFRNSLRAFYIPNANLSRIDPGYDLPEDDGTALFDFHALCRQEFESCARNLGSSGSNSGGRAGQSQADIVGHLRVSPC